MGRLRMLVFQHPPPPRPARPGRRKIRNQLYPTAPFENQGPVPFAADHVDLQLPFDTGCGKKGVKGDGYQCGAVIFGKDGRWLGRPASLWF